MTFEQEERLKELSWRLVMRGDLTPDLLAEYDALIAAQDAERRRDAKRVARRKADSSPAEAPSVARKRKSAPRVADE